MFYYSVLLLMHINLSFGSIYKIVHKHSSNKLEVPFAIDDDKLKFIPKNEEGQAIVEIQEKYVDEIFKLILIQLKNKYPFHGQYLPKTIEELYIIRPTQNMLRGLYAYYFQDGITYSKTNEYRIQVTNPELSPALLHHFLTSDECQEYFSELSIKDLVNLSKVSKSVQRSLAKRDKSEGEGIRSNRFKEYLEIDESKSVGFNVRPTGMLAVLLPIKDILDKNALVANEYKKRHILNAELAWTVSRADIRNNMTKDDFISSWVIVNPFEGELYEAEQAKLEKIVKTLIPLILKKEYPNKIDQSGIEIQEAYNKISAIYDEFYLPIYNKSNEEVRQLMIDRRDLIIHQFIVVGTALMPIVLRGLLL